MHIINNIKSFIKSFKYAFCGIISAVKSERNMRVHLCATFYVIILMQFYDLTVEKKCLIFVIIGLIISLELVNTALESVVDLCSPKYSELAKKAKDASAGAVLVSAMVSVIVAFYVFWDKDTFKSIFKYFKSNELMFTALIISVVFWFWFIFAIKKESNKN